MNFFTVCENCGQTCHVAGCINPQCLERDWLAIAAQLEEAAKRARQKAEDTTAARQPGAGG